MRFELKRLAVWPFIKVSFFFNFIMGFFLGLLYVPFFSMYLAILPSILGMSESGESLIRIPFGVLLILLPICMAFFMCIFNTFIGTVAVLVYNVVVKLTGGLEVDLETAAVSLASASPTYYTASPGLPVQPPPPPPQPQTPPPPPPPPPPSSDQPMPPGSKYE